MPAEVERGDQPVTSPSDFEANAITIEHLRFRSGATNVVHRSPIRGLDQPIPPLKRNRRFRMHATVVQEDLSCNYPHARFIALFPPWEQEGNLARRRTDVNELTEIENDLTPSARFALQSFFDR